MSEEKKETKEEKEEKLVESTEEQNYELSRILRFILVSCFILSNITYSADVGVIASSKFKLQKDLNFNDKEFATFNSITSTGRILGTFVYMVLLTRDNRKILTTITLLSSCAIFFSFLFTSQKFVLFGIRFLLGLTRNFFQIYVPVYVDQFGVKPLKTIMISICNITSPLGRTLGFAIGTALGEDRWRYSFSCVGLILLSLAIIIILSPNRYFAAAAEFKGYYIKNLDNSTLKLVPAKDDKNLKYTNSVFGTGKIKKTKGGLDFNEILGILKNPSFMFSTFTRASVSFIFDITHLFIKDYVQNGLGEKDQILLLSYYSIASGIGPWIGGSVGGSIVTYFGGYEHKNSCKVISIFSVCTLITTYFLCYTNTLFTFCASLFAFYATAYMFYPIITGYAVNALNAKQKGTGYSFTILICTICGNFPGPLYYGIINDHFKETNPRMAWRCSIFYYIVGFTLLQFACYYRYQDLKRKEEENQKNKEEEEEEEMKEIETK